MTFGKKIVGIIAVFVSLIQCATFGGEGGSNISLAAAELVKKIEVEFPRMATRDTNELLIGLSVPSKYNDDRSLRLISEIESIRALKLIGTPSANAPALTPVGIMYLERMSNLVSLEFFCYQKAGLNAGVLSTAAKITQLRDFYLYYSEAPSEEYNSVTNMMNLTSLRVVGCSNFGDAELRVVTNLAGLKTLVLNGTGVTHRGTNMLKDSLTITNVHFRE